MWKRCKQGGVALVRVTAANRHHKAGWRCFRREGRGFGFAQINFCVCSLSVSSAVVVGKVKEIFRGAAVKNTDGHGHFLYHVLIKYCLIAPSL